MGLTSHSHEPLRNAKKRIHSFIFGPRSTWDGGSLGIKVLLTRHDDLGGFACKNKSLCSFLCYYFSREKFLHSCILLFSDFVLVSISVMMGGQGQNFLQACSHWWWRPVVHGFLLYIRCNNFRGSCRWKAGGPSSHLLLCNSFFKLLV